MPQVLIVYWSKYGNTKQVAETIAQGIKAAKQVEVTVKDVKKTKPEEALEYDGLIIGSPNHGGGPVGDIKKFLKKLEKLDLKGKTGAVFDTHAGTGFGAVQKMEKQIREKIPGLKLVAPGLATQIKGFLKGPLVEGELLKAEEFEKSISTKI
ncbi:MAG: flavodoxin family protein [Candidatus Jordarchaeum sp.]|uniref:flavodoxin family protein n=1 Tax=Candidatus Jordarchaeum sp. TaxID=2823881 RepID=UPI00404983FF